MTANTYICLNGDFLKNSEPRIFTNNRAFRYGDAISEKIHAYATEPQFLKLHLERLLGNMRNLSMDVPAFLTHQNIHSLIVSLLNKNRIFGGANVRLTIYRAEGEDLIPSENKVSWLIESFALIPDKYVLNERGWIVGISGDFIKSPGKLSELPRFNSHLFLMASLECKKNKLDSVILLNPAGRLVEAMNSNVFLVSGRSVFTPGIDQGCVPGVMRKIIIDCAIESGYQVNDLSSLTPAALLDAEEVFLTNAIEGIRWVGAYLQTRYFNKTAKLLTVRLNEKAF